MLIAGFYSSNTCMYTHTRTLTHVHTHTHTTLTHVLIISLTHSLISLTHSLTRSLTLILSSLAFTILSCYIITGQYQLLTTHPPLSHDIDYCSACNASPKKTKTLAETLPTKRRWRKYGQTFQDILHSPRPCDCHVTGEHYREYINYIPRIPYYFYLIPYSYYANYIILCASVCVWPKILSVYSHCKVEMNLQWTCHDNNVIAVQNGKNECLLWGLRWRHF